ncbi:hypothetical protein BU16DRAFT_522420 [Lophium mytilinum]|uniref:SnoaL-like domain-containing protein n=1 Tax=Lophium mytilinum TaxID=390894 RepID=A0A6A6RDD7_9PEZI|nr:hypothetical protein BU16DRAFT_522420 [Lophium mytilinum]
MDNAAIIAARAPSCLRHFHPKSLNYPPQDNAAYKRNLDSMHSVFANFSLTVTDCVEDVAARKISMWLEARGDTAAGEYVNEYVWNMEFDEAGEKIVGWREFVDVGMARDFFPRLMVEVRKRREEEAAAEGGA